MEPHGEQLPLAVTSPSGSSALASSVSPAIEARELYRFYPIGDDETPRRDEGSELVTRHVLDRAHPRADARDHAEMMAGATRERLIQIAEHAPDPGGGVRAGV